MEQGWGQETQQHPRSSAYHQDQRPNQRRNMHGVEEENQRVLVEDEDHTKLANFVNRDADL